MKTKKNRVFISYQFRGILKEDLFATIPKIHKAIETAGHNHYSTLFESEQYTTEKWSGKEIMNKAMKEIDSSSVVLFYVHKIPESQGMLVELGYALSKKKRCILAINKNITQSIFRRLIDEIIEFETLEDLTQKLTKYSI
jgi:nucleoside 2-deoxyribosyltransferase